MHLVKPIAAMNRVDVFIEDQTEEGHDDFGFQLKKAIDQVKTAGGEFDLLVDMSKTTVMSPNSAQRSEELIGWCVANGLRKSANVLSETLHQLQVKRLTGRNEKFGIFTSRHEAEAWLSA